jgi:hypothetical protein
MFARIRQTLTVASIQTMNPTIATGVVTIPIDSAIDMSSASRAGSTFSDEAILAKARFIPIDVTTTPAISAASVLRPEIRRARRQRRSDNATSLADASGAAYGFAFCILFDDQLMPTGVHKTERPMSASTAQV